jgi:hypothetical protein
LVRAGDAAGAPGASDAVVFLGFSGEIFLILQADPVARGASWMRTGEFVRDLPVRSC